MSPRVFKLAVELLLRDSKELSIRGLMELAPCDVGQARKVLSELHKSGLTHIVRWKRSRGAPCPVYAKGCRPDAPRPTPLTKAQQSKAYRERKPEIAEVYNARKRNARRTKAAIAEMATRAKTDLLQNWIPVHRPREEDEWI